MSYSITEVRKMIDADGETILDWCYHFRDYLPSEVSRKKNTVRSFSEEEVRVFIYIYYYWEDDPDIECIKVGLNSDEHWEEPFRKFFNQVIPIFRDIPDGPENYADSSFLLNGMSERTQHEIARGYKAAADILVDHALESVLSQHELGYTILFFYRHSLELYIKEMNGYEHRTGGKGAHSILTQLEDLENKFSKRANSWVRKKLEELNLWDLSSEGFRYADSLSYGNSEVLVHLPQLRAIMNDIISAFEGFIRNETGKYFKTNSRE